MLSKNLRSRLYLFTILLIGISLVGFFIFKALEKNVVYFFSPTEIYNSANISVNKNIRIGGLVKINSINKNGDFIEFIVTDLKNEIIVTYKGIVPNLFLEGKGVVAEGYLKDKKYFVAKEILAKHDENYMPPEVSEILKKAK